MWGWMLAYFGTFVIVFVMLFVVVQIASRWAHYRGKSNLYLSGRWLRELHGE